MAEIAADEIVEHTLAQIQECYLFSLPPRVRAQGWLAADMTKQMWTGRLRVVQRGMEAAIMLVDRRDGKLFAMCKVEDGAVERVPDSSRYFVVKIQNAQGRHAFVGLAFDDRNQAFDFNVALQEFKKDKERSSMLDAKGTSAAGEEEEDEAMSVSKADLSLKQGEKIKISIGGASKTSSRPRRSGARGGAGGGGGLTLAPPPGDTARKSSGGGIGLLAPPPGDTRRARSIAKPQPPPASSSEGAGSSMPSGGITSSGGAGGVHQAGSNEGGSGSGGFDGLGGGGGLLGDNSGGSSSGGATQAPPPVQEDDDPFGLGIGSASSGPLPQPPQHQQNQELGLSSFASPPSAAPSANNGSGLSDMSGLGYGLPSNGTQPFQQQPPPSAVFGGQQTSGHAQYPVLQQQQQQQHAFPQPGAGGASGTSTSANSLAAADDPFGGLF